MFNWGTQELLIVALIALLLFGSAKLPKLMRDMGKSIGEFKAGLQDKPKKEDGLPKNLDQDLKNENELGEKREPQEVEN